MSAEDLEKYETEMELQLYREYRDVVGLFAYVVETERRFYLTNAVDLKPRSSDGGEVYFEVTMSDAWVWDMYRPARFVKNVRVADVQGRQRRGARPPRALGRAAGGVGGRPTGRGMPGGGLLAVPDRRRDPTGQHPRVARQRGRCGSAISATRSTCAR